MSSLAAETKNESQDRLDFHEFFSNIQSRASMDASCQDGSFDALVWFVGQEMIELWLARCGLYVQEAGG